ncbi:MAG: hypothetical protein AAGA83_24765 [Cyanobacteria bacterium P01_F01_bin.116]
MSSFNYELLNFQIQQMQGFMEKVTDTLSDLERNMIHAEQTRREVKSLTTKHESLAQKVRALQDKGMDTSFKANLIWAIFGAVGVALLTVFIDLIQVPTTTAPNITNQSQYVIPSDES